MPILTVVLAAPESAALSREVAAGLVELTQRILRKPPEVTAVAVQYIKPEHWIIAGVPLSDQGRTSFFFDIRITDETNTKTEKAQYIREAFELFGRLLGNVHDESYIHVHDVRAASYGYGGRTQEYRFHH